MTALSEVHKATIAVNNEVLQLSGNDVSDVAWMEDVNFTVDDAYPKCMTTWRPEKTIQSPHPA